jgi:hypothetical protein
VIIPGAKEPPGSSSSSQVVNPRAKRTASEMDTAASEVSCQPDIACAQIASAYAHVGALQLHSLACLCTCVRNLMLNLFAQSSHKLLCTALAPAIHQAHVAGTGSSMQPANNKRMRANSE